MRDHENEPGARSDERENLNVFHAPSSSTSISAQSDGLRIREDKPISTSFSPLRMRSGIKKTARRARRLATQDDSFLEVWQTCGKWVMQIYQSCDSSRLHRKRKLHDMHILLSVSPKYYSPHHANRKLQNNGDSGDGGSDGDNEPPDCAHSTPPRKPDRPVFYGDSYPTSESPWKVDQCTEGSIESEDSEMKERFRRILKKSKFACAFPTANGSDEEGIATTTPPNAPAWNASQRSPRHDEAFDVNQSGGAELLNPSTAGPSTVGPSTAGPSSGLRNEIPSTFVPQASAPTGSDSRNNSEAANPSTDQHSSRTSLGRKRAPDEVYKYVREIDETNTFECKSCGKVLGKRNATRFKRHCIEKCTGLHTPIKQELRLHSKSRTIGDPKNRSRIGLALQRDDALRGEDALGIFDDENEAQVERPVRKISSGSRDSKTRKLSTMTTGKASSSTDPYIFVRSILEFIILKGLPFNIFDSQPGSESEAVKMFQCRDPTLTKSDIPSGKALAGRELDRFYLDVQKNVKDRVLSALRQGYGSLIFDGWDDVNSSPVVNVLLRTEGNIDAGRRTFFLSSVYTGCKKSGANEYVSILENVMRPYGGFDRICAITSDNASSCLNTRKLITEKHAGIVGVNDQSHVADLLMEDMGKLSWIKEVLARVSNISNELHNHRKLKSRYEALIVEYNAFVKSFHKAEGGTSNPRTKQEGSLTSSG